MSPSPAFDNPSPIVSGTVVIPAAGWAKVDVREQPAIGTAWTLSGLSLRLIIAGAAGVNPSLSTAFDVFLSGELIDRFEFTSVDPTQHIADVHAYLSGFTIYDTTNLEIRNGSTAAGGFSANNFTMADGSQLAYRANVAYL